MDLPDFRRIAQLLGQAEPIKLDLAPGLAYSLVAQLQLALRHPGNTGASAIDTREFTQALQQRLARIDGAIAESLETGWNPQFDVTEAEFQQAQQTGTMKRRVEVHNVLTLYEVGPHGSVTGEKFLSFGHRPQDWGHPRWHYHQVTVEFEDAAARYTNHCHIWQEVDRPIVKALAAVGEGVYWVMQPGSPPELCGRDYLADEDFWEPEWGEMPPVWRSPDEDDDLYLTDDEIAALGGEPYDDPVVLYDPETGPVTDSQLRDICDRVAQEGEG